MDVPPCPECASEEHEVLRQTAEHVTVRCLACHSVRTTAVPRPRSIQVPIVYSDGDRSWRDTLAVAPDEPVAVGDEFEEAGHRYLVTGVERRDGVGATRAPARDLRQLAAKRFDEVRLKLTINLGDTTRSAEVPVDPDEPIQVGQVLRAEGQLVRVKALKSDQNRTVRRGFLRARSIVRVFCDAAPEGAREGEVARKPPGGVKRGARKIH